MTDGIGEKWFQDIFLTTIEPERPQLLILDGHSSHETLGLLQCAMEEIPTEAPEPSMAAENA